MSGEGMRYGAKQIEAERYPFPTASYSGLD